MRYLYGQFDEWNSEMDDIIKQHTHSKYVDAGKSFAVEKYFLQKRY